LFLFDLWLPSPANGKLRLTTICVHIPHVLRCSKTPTSNPYK
jgi:hypothetical protein